jgi:hypothetical protein
MDYSFGSYNPTKELLKQREETIAKIQEFKEILQAAKNRVIKEGRLVEASHLLLQQYEPLYRYRNTDSRRHVMEHAEFGGLKPENISAYAKQMSNLQRMDGGGIRKKDHDDNLDDSKSSNEQRPSKFGFTPKEDFLLLSLLEECGELNTQNVNELCEGIKHHFPKRDPLLLVHRVVEMGLLKAGAKEVVNEFTEEEDARLLALPSDFGQWKELSLELIRHKPKQIRDRYLYLVRVHE